MTITLNDLKTLSGLIKDIQRFKEQIEELTSRIEGSKPAHQGIRGTPRCDPLGDDYARRDELKEMLETRQAELSSWKLWVEHELTGFPEPERQILLLRYCEGLSWEEIGQKTNYHKVTCMKLHKRALESLSARKWLYV